MDTTAKGLAPFSVGLRYSRRGAGGTGLKARHPHPSWSPGRRENDAGSVADGSGTRSSRARSSAAARSSGSGDSTSTRSAGERVVEREPRRVQELPFEAEVADDAVDRVAGRPGARSPRGGRGSGACAPSRAVTSSRARAPQQLHDLEARHRLARGRRVERVARLVAAVAADRRLDPPRARARRALRRARGSAARRAARRIASCSRSCASSERATTSRPEVSRSSRWTIPGRSSSPPAASCVEQPVHERAGRVPGARVDDDARRLVDDEQVLVLPGDVQVHRLRLERRRASGGQLDDDVLPALQPVALRRAASPSTRTAPPAISRSASAREPTSGRPATRAVEPLGLRGAKAESCQRGGAGLRSVGPGERPEEGRDADDDEGVGEVERRPEAEVEEVRHVAEPDAVERGSRCCRRARSRAPTGSTGWRAPERAKKTSIQATASAVSAITIDVALEKSPNAIPEFCTWWIENGPAMCDLLAERERARDDLLRQLVGDDGGDGDRAEPDPLARPARRAAAPRPRSAAARSSTSRRARRAGGGPRARPARSTPSFLASSMQSVVHGTASSRSSRNRLAAVRADAVRAVLDPLQRRVDLAGAASCASSSSPSSSSRS